MNIFAGHEVNVYEGAYLDEVELSELPEHMQVGVPTADDEATYAEADLSDAELIALAAEDAEAAHAAGVITGPALDDLSLRRMTRRAHRAEQASALRAIGGVA